MDAEHASNIFTVALTEDNSRVLSGGNDQKVIIHDTQTSAMRNNYAIFKK